MDLTTNRDLLKQLENITDVLLEILDCLREIKTNQNDCQ